MGFSLGIKRYSVLSSIYLSINKGGFIGESQLKVFGLLLKYAGVCEVLFSDTI
jgi:hypothetical protein